MKTYLPFVFVILLLAVSVVAAQCGAAPAVQDTADAEIMIEEPYARASIPNGAVFMTLMNEGNSDDVLISAESEVAKAVELHESKMNEDGVMKMSPVPNIPVAAGGSATLKPGGLHVMLMGLQKELAVGDTFTVTLNFEKAGPQTIEVEVRESMMAQMDDMDHGEDEMEMDSMSAGESDIEGMEHDQE